MLLENKAFAEDTNTACFVSFKLKLPIEAPECSASNSGLRVSSPQPRNGQHLSVGIFLAMASIMKKPGACGSVDQR